MADADLPISGKDVKVTITVDGVLKQVHDQVTNFTRKQVHDEIETKHLGKTGAMYDQVFVRWEGTIEFAESRKVLDDIVDALSVAREARVPVVINITELVHYRNMTSKKYTYPDVSIGDVESSAARGEARKFSLPWKCGNHRIAA